MSDFVSSVLDELVPTFSEEAGDWGRVVADAGAETPTSAQPWLLDMAAASAAPRRRHGTLPARWLTRRRLVAVAVAAVLAALLVTPALGIGDRLLSLIQGKPTPLDVQAPAWSPDGRTIVFVSWRDGNGEVYAMDANGSGPRNLTQNPAKDVPTCLVARRAQHRVCEQSSPLSLQTWTWTAISDGIRDLRHERRREQEAEPHAGSCERRPSNLVTRRAEDRVLARPRPTRGQLYVVNADGSGLRNLGRIAGRRIVRQSAGLVTGRADDLLRALPRQHRRERSAEAPVHTVDRRLVARRAADRLRGQPGTGLPGPAVR